MNMKCVYSSLLLSILLISSANTSQAARTPREHWYQEVWCKGMGGKVEHRLKSGRRIDCLTDQFAIEVEFAHKWTEAIGQSLDYSMITGKSAGIVLILRKASDKKYWQRLNKMIKYHQLPIKLWKLNP